MCFDRHYCLVKEIWEIIHTPALSVCDNWYLHTEKEADYRSRHSFRARLRKQGRVYLASIA